MIQTRKLGIVNANKGAKVHKVQTSYADSRLVTWCSSHHIYQLVELDPSDADRLCQRCFDCGPLPWEGTM